MLDFTPFGCTLNKVNNLRVIQFAVGKVKGLCFCVLVV